MTGAAVLLLGLACVTGKCTLTVYAVPAAETVALENTVSLLIKDAPETSNKILQPSISGPQQTHKSQPPTDVTDPKKGVIGIQERQSELERQKSQLSTDATTWKSQDARMMRREDGLKTELSRLQLNVANLVTELDTTRQRQAELETQMSELEGKVVGLTQENSLVKQRLEDLNHLGAEHAELQRRQVELETQSSELSAEAAQCRNQGAELENKIGRLEQQLQKRSQENRDDTALNVSSTTVKLLERRRRETHHNMSWNLASANLTPLVRLAIVENTVSGLMRAVKDLAIRLPQSCMDTRYKYPSSGVQSIMVGRGLLSKEVSVFCDQVTTSGGWTVIQRRFNGSQPFNKGWEDYETGFGDATGEYWIGLRNIHAMTSERENVLRVELEDLNRATFYAEYTTFRVFGPQDYYRLSVGGYSGTAADGMSFHSGLNFTTIDRDNDQFQANCATMFQQGGWWYKDCATTANLNGIWGADDIFSKINWKGLIDGKKQIVKTAMKIRQKYLHSIYL